MMSRDLRSVSLTVLAAAAVVSAVAYLLLEVSVVRSRLADVAPGWSCKAGMHEGCTKLAEQMRAAIDHDDLPTVLAILEYGLPVDHALDIHKSTALMIAAERCVKPETAKALLDHGANTERRNDPFRNNAYEIAVGKKCDRLASMLKPAIKRDEQ